MVYVLQVVVKTIILIKNIKNVNHVLLVVPNVLDLIINNVYFVNLIIYYQIINVYHIVHINIFIISYQQNVNIVMSLFIKIHV